MSQGKGKASKKEKKEEKVVELEQEVAELIDTELLEASVATKEAEKVYYHNGVVSASPNLKTLTQTNHARLLKKQQKIKSGSRSSLLWKRLGQRKSLRKKKRRN